MTARFFRNKETFIVRARGSWETLIARTVFPYGPYPMSVTWCLVSGVMEAGFQSGYRIVWHLCSRLGKSTGNLRLRLCLFPLV